MKIGIVGDIHFSEYSSILRGRGMYYSTRLENCVTSINWAESATADCDQIIYLGDFFDKSSLNAEEITALNAIKWNNKVHRFLVGNHEMGINSLAYSSAHIFNDERREVIDKAFLAYYDEGTELVFLPYVLEDNRTSLDDMFPPKQDGVSRIIFSHNDIAGIQLGQFISTAGYSIEEIERNCDLFFNGHLHNGMPITNKIINVGNLTGQNFSEDGFKYSHNIFILDTDTMTYEILENPHAINFYKIEGAKNVKDLNRVKNAVVTVKVKADIAPELKRKMDEDPNIIASRLIIDYGKSEKKDIESLSVDHLEEFRKFVYTRLEGEVDSELLREEVEHIYV